MKINGKRTALMVGDIIILNEKEQTLKIKRGKEFLDFVTFMIKKENVIESLNVMGELRTYYNTLGTVVLFGIILSTINLEPVPVIGSGNPEEKSYQLQKYPEY